MAGAPRLASFRSRCEPVLIAHASDWVIDYGDVNSTLTAAVVAAKLKQRLAHV